MMDELRPPPEHEDKPLHWIETDRGNITTWRWRDSCWTDEDGSRLYPRDADGCRYLGPAEPPDSSLNPYDPNSQLALVHRADYLRDLARLRDLEAEVATLRDRLASVEAHNVELVAKYEALRMASVPARPSYALPPNALRHSR